MRAEFLLQSDDVNGATSSLQVNHAHKDATMGVEQEVVGPKFGSLLVEAEVEQGGPKDRTFDVDAAQISPLPLATGTAAPLSMFLMSAGRIRLFRPRLLASNNLRL